MLGLTFEVHESHLQNEGKLTLRCVASVNSIPSDSSSHHNQYLSNNNNPPPAASSTASLGGYEVNAGRTSSPEHFYNPLIIETMSMVSEVRFEGKTHNKHASYSTYSAMCKMETVKIHTHVTSGSLYSFVMV